MTKRVYISADYAENDGDRLVVDILNLWGQDNYHKVDFVDMAKVAKGTVAKDPDCRSCDLKNEFNQQINASSAVIFVVGDKTADRTAGSGCNRAGSVQNLCSCTPFKQNANGRKPCRVSFTRQLGPNDDIGNINSYSYLRHEFEQAKRRNKKIIIVYNSTRYEEKWLPAYMEGYERIARPFWIINSYGQKVGNYQYIKEALGF